MDYTEISKELLEMKIEDQKVREIYLNLGVKDRTPEKFKELVSPIDQKNIKRLEEIVNEIGLPTISKVGKDASYAAWLIAQHAPLSFMKRYLKLQEENLNDIDPKNYAYLKDRVLIRHGELQEFGTQYQVINGANRLHQLKDPENVDKKRAEVGLEPLCDYLAKNNVTMYWCPRRDSAHSPNCL